jgi:hypothetical protein
MAFATIEACNAGVVLGSFIERERGHRFEFATRDPLRVRFFAPEFPHAVFVGPFSEERAALVMRTVAYIVTDEDAAGFPVVEKWEIKNRRDYVQQ